LSEDIQIRAARAQQLLEDEILMEALDSLVKENLYQAALADLGNPTQCVGAVAAIQAISAFSGKLQEYITAGKAAERKPFKVA
jgi:hypothetical protein